MRNLGLLLSSLTAGALCAATSTAQDLTIKALTNISALAKSGGVVDFNTVAAGAAVTVTEKASHSEHLTVYYTSAKSATGYATLTQSANASYIDIINNSFVHALTAKFLHNGTTQGDGVSGTSSSTAAGNATHGPNSFLVTIRHPSNVVGKLRLAWRAQHNAKANSTARIDIGNNGTVDYTFDSTQATSAEQYVPVSFTNGPLVVKVTIEGFSDAQGEGGYHNYYGNLALNLVKQGSCKLVTYGNPCGSARLDAGILQIGSMSILQMKLSGGVANGFFVRVVGDQRVNVPLPGGCALLADPDILELLRADSVGASSEAFQMPANQNLVAAFQYVPFDLVNGQILPSSTNAWELICSGF